MRTHATTVLMMFFTIASSSRLSRGQSWRWGAVHERASGLKAVIPTAAVLIHWRARAVICNWSNFGWRTVTAARGRHWSLVAGRSVHPSVRVSTIVGV